MSDLYSAKIPGFLSYKVSKMTFTLHLLMYLILGLFFILITHSTSSKKTTILVNEQRYQDSFGDCIFVKYLSKTKKNPCTNVFLFTFQIKKD